MPLTPAELHIWDNDPGEITPRLADREINEKYARGEGRIVIENNREKLPGFVNLIKQPGYMDLRPFYQRRPRWSVKQQSLLVESFIMNIPVPPVFLYEKEFNSYEVMDGQQRITAIRDFYDNAFKLSGLQTWPELNGRFYRNLPENIKAGIDRRSINSIVLLKESTDNEEEASSLREIVFERLNTGGIKLERQEIRNALYRGPFNDMLDRITRSDIFRDVWGLPHYVPEEITSNPEILKNPLFAKMGDSEIALRFFALRHANHYRNGMQGFLDIYMRRAASFSESDALHLESLYMDTLTLARGIYGDLTFRPFQRSSQQWEGKPHRAFQDAVMIGLSQHLGEREILLQRKASVVGATQALFLSQEDGTFTGRGNTKADVQDRIALYEQMLTHAAT